MKRICISKDIPTWKTPVFTQNYKNVEMNQKFSKKCFLLFIYHLHFVKSVSSKFIFLSKALTQTDFIFDLQCHTFDSFFLKWPYSSFALLSNVATFLGFACFDIFPCH